MVAAGLLASLGLLALGQDAAPPISWVNPRLPAGPGLSHHVLASRALGHDVGWVIWLPPQYESQTTARYPLVVFLHGMGGTEAADSAGFSGHLSKAIQAGSFPPAVILFPNGGRSGYRGAVEEMIMDEVIPAAEGKFRIKPGGKNRVVLGFSMGGSGAVHLSLSRPEAFAAAASLGGGFRSGSPETDGLFASAKATLKERGWGLFTVNGDSDRPDAFDALGQKMKEAGISFESMTLPDTGHDLGRYYELGLPGALKLLASKLAKGEG